MIDYLDLRYFNLASPRYNRHTEGGRTFIITTVQSIREKFSIIVFKTKRLGKFF